MIDAPPTPPTHAIGAALYMVLERGGHATPPKRSWRVVQHETPARVTDSGWITTYTRIPKAPKACTVRYGKNNAAAKRMGLVSVTWSCPDSVDTGI